jgi:trehalose 6-phosphate synthase/phosphatase
MPANNQGQYSRIHFRVWAKTSLGQKVGVGGSVSTLGNFDTSRVVHLVTTPESYPVWYTLEPIVVPRGRSVSFNFCSIEGGSFKAFESVNVRTLTPDRVDVIVEETFNPQKLVGVGSDSEQNILKDLSEMRSESNQSLQSMDSEFTIGSTLFIACYHLPLAITRSALDDGGFQIEWDHSLISSAGDLSKFSLNMATFWVGTVCVEGPALTVSEQEILTTRLAVIKCIPIFLPDEVVQNGYYGYCKQVLWSCFHNVERIDHMHSAWRAQEVTSACHRNHEHHHASTPSSSTNTSTSLSGSDVLEENSCEDLAVYDFWKNDTFADWFVAYNDLNQFFAKKLKELCKEQDIVWVHDYHLCLLPGQLRESLKQLHMIFFLHIPFPTSQIFRSLPTSTKLLSSMVAANVVGFHTFDYSRHFLHATRRMLGARSHTVEGGIMAATINGKRLLISMSQVSIEPTFLRKALANSETFVETKRLKARFSKKRVIVGIQTCQKLSGIEFKLEAFRLFLEDNIGKPCNVIMSLAVLRPNNRPDDEEYTSQQLRKMVNHINSTYGKEGEVLVDYSEHTSLNINQRVAMWLSGDIFLRTSIREGLNLMPMEYLFVRKELEDAGVIIASEFSVCSTLLNGSIKINPFDTRKIADALHIALSMTTKEKNSRRSRDMEIVCSHPSDLWAQQILADLKTAKVLSDAGSSASAPPQRHSRHSWKAPPRSQPLAISATSSDKSGEENIQECLPLSIPRFLDAYDSAMLTRGLIRKGSRVFIFDYGGTLISNEKFDIYMKQTLSAITGRLPSKPVLESIRILSDDPNNCVLILTHITRDKMMGLFDDMPNVSIACSNGVVTTWGANLVDMMSDLCYEEDMVHRVGNCEAMLWRNEWVDKFMSE